MSLELSDPDFRCNLNVDCKYIAGLRPHRKGTYRLEAVMKGNKFIVHNYGHGGAGITMSWGCADKVRQLVRQRHAPDQGHPVAVLGGGVMGLTAAALLKEDGYAVALYAKKFEGTTSDVAGGQWAPSIVKYDQDNPASVRRFVDILRTAYRMHREKLGPKYGVSERVNYCKTPGDGLKLIAENQIIPPATQLARLPFAHLDAPGWAFQTLLVEPPIFLKQLRDDLKPHVPFHQKTFASEADVLGLAEPIIVNCTGLGSKNLFNDPAMEPIKGQLVLAHPQANLNYLYSTGTTYVFPRTDHVVVGGSYETENEFKSENPDPTICARIRQVAENVFAGRALLAEEMEYWMMKGK